MDYEKAYKDALETARKINSGEGVAAPPDWTICEVIFPELKESEDERISREITEFILTHRIDEPNDIEDTNSWLAWLEKKAQSTTITIPEDLKGTDTDGGVVGEMGEQGEQSSNKNFKERYENIGKSEWFKRTHDGMSVSDENLMMASVKHEGWVNIYKHTCNDETYYTSNMAASQEEAEKWRTTNTVATVKIEWEEQQ